MESFEQRKAEVISYLDFLHTMEQIMSKSLSITDSENKTSSITGDQYKILIANVYIILYNLIESTIFQCFENIEESIQSLKKEEVKNLSPQIKRDLVLFYAEQTKEEDAFDRILEITEKFYKDECVPKFKLKQTRQNWDDQLIEKAGKRYSIDLELTGELRTTIKKHYKDDYGMVQFVKERRNQLAHGAMRFTEIANEETFRSVHAIAYTVFEYLEDIISKFDKYISEKKYLINTSDLNH